MFYQARYAGLFDCKAHVSQDRRLQETMVQEIPNGSTGSTKLCQNSE